MLQTGCLHTKSRALIRLFSVSTYQDINQKWREERGLPINPNAYGVLTDRPDYSYLDGRPTPIGARQSNRLLKQREIAENIIKFTNEMDFAVARHEKLKIEAEAAKKAILDSKLKPKGKLLYKK